MVVQQIWHQTEYYLSRGLENEGVEGDLASKNALPPNQKRPFSAQPKMSRNSSCEPFASMIWIAKTLVNSDQIGPDKILLKTLLSGPAGNVTKLRLREPRKPVSNPLVLR